MIHGEGERCGLFSEIKLQRSRLPRTKKHSTRDVETKHAAILRRLVPRLSIGQRGLQDVMF